VALTETLDAFLADFGVSVSFSGSTAGMLGIPDAPGALQLASITGVGEGAQFPGVQTADKTVLIRTDQKGALAPGTAITVNGVSGTTRYLLAHEDGAFTLVWWR
jgi:hypothetical protein